MKRKSFRKFRRRHISRRRRGYRSIIKMSRGGIRL